MVRRGKRSGVKKPDSKGMRTCVGCHKKHLPSDLCRLIADHDGALWVDRFNKAPGRGVHLCYNHKCIELAHRSRAIERSLKRAELSWSVEQLCDQIVVALDEKLRANLAFAQLANGLVSGMDSIERQRHQVAGFVLAVDAAENSEKRLEKWAQSLGIECLRLWNAEELGESIGKLHRVAVGICDKKIWEKVTSDVNRRRGVLIAGCGQQP